MGLYGHEEVCVCCVYVCGCGCGCGCVCLCLVFARLCICLFVCLPVLTSTYVVILKALVYRLDPASAQEKLDFEGALKHQEKVQLWYRPYIDDLNMQELFAKYTWPNADSFALMT